MHNLVLKLTIKQRLYRLYTSMRRLQWWRWSIRKKYYWLRWGFHCNDFSADGTILPEFGPGQFVSVLRHGPYWEITSHSDRPRAPKGMIRLIPVQYNHGLFVEYRDEAGHLQWRRHLDYDQLIAFGAQGREAAR